jgi:type VI secretion system protein ImpK
MMRPGERRSISGNPADRHWSRDAVKTLFEQAAPPRSVSPVRDDSSVTLRTLATDLFLIGVKIRDAADLGTPESLKKLLVSYFSAFEDKCLSAGKAREFMNHSKYALAAFIDETVLNRGGEVHEYWIREPLTVKFFSDPVAGENFFSRLDSHIENVRKNKEVIEIYYLCVCLGFQGKYKMSGPEKLPVIIENLLRRIEGVQGSTPRAFSPSANVPPGSPPMEKRGRRLMGAALILFFLGFVFYSALMLMSPGALKKGRISAQKVEEIFYQR